MLRVISSVRLARRASNLDQAKAERSVRRAISAALGIPVEKLKAALWAESVVWADASLGLGNREPSHSSPLVPGYVLSAQVEGAWYTYHANTKGDVKLASKVSAEDAKTAISEVVASALRHFYVPAEKVRIIGVSAKTFPWRFNGREGIRTVYDVTALIDGDEKRYYGELGRLRENGAVHSS